MADVQIRLTEFSDLITRYTADFVGRQWLVKQVDELLNDPDCRFVVLTGSAGVGKTAFLAHLATTHLQWPRYFIRRDSKDLLRPGDANTFLLTIGGQLATLYPHLFHPENLEVVIRQQIGSVETGGKVAAARIEELRISPFYHVAMLVEQEIKRVTGKATALEIGRLVSEPRLLGMQDLQYLGLIDPARLLAQEDPDAQIVVLVDALDELRYSPAEPDIVRTLREMPEMPPNLRFVIGSRPETFLCRLLARSDARELPLDVNGADNRADLRTYAEDKAGGDSWQTVLAQEGLSPKALVDGLLGRATGNFLYLRSVLGGIQQALEDPTKREEVSHLLRVEELPGELGGLYGHFLSFIVRWAEGKFGPAAWREYLRPYLGTLAVAQEPLGEEQLIALADLRREDIRDLRRELRQFIETIGSQYPLYRIYHASFAEYLLDREQNRDYWINGKERHRRIADRYLGAWGGIEGGLPELQDPARRDLDGGYGLRHLAVHLAQSERIDDLQDLVEDPSWYLARSRQDPSHRGYVDDLDLAFTVTLPQGTDGWPSLAANSLIRTTLAGLAGGLPDEAYEALVRLNRGYEALDRARMILDRSKKAQVFEMIRDAALELGLASLVDEVQRQSSLVADARDSSEIEEDEDWLTEVVSTYGAERTLHDFLLRSTDIYSDRSEDVKQYIRVAKVALQLGRIEEGRQVLLGCLEFVAETWDWNRWEFLTQIARLLVQAGNDSALFRVIDLARDIGTEPERTHCLAELAVICSEMNDTALHRYSLGFALTEMENGEQKKHLAQDMGKVALAMSRIGDERASEFLEKALVLSEEQAQNSSRRPEQTAWLNMAAALASAGLCDEAVNLISIPDLPTYMREARHVLLALALQGSWQYVRIIAQDLPPTIRTWVLLAISNELARREQLSMKQYESVVSQIEKDRPSHLIADTWVQAVKRLIQLAIRMQDFAGARTYLSHLINLIENMPSILQARAIEEGAHYANVAHDKGSLDRLVELAEALPEDNHYSRSTALAALSLALAAIGQTSHAWSLAKDIDANWRRLEAIVHICQLAQERNEEISEYFKYAVDLARQMENKELLPTRWGTLALLADQLGCLLERNECVEQATQGVRTSAASLIADNAANVALTLHKIGLADQAHALLEYATNYLDSPQVIASTHSWQRLIGALTETGERNLLSQVQQAVERIEDPGRKAGLMLGVLNARMQLEDRERAMKDLPLVLVAVLDAGSSFSLVNRFNSILLQSDQVPSQEIGNMVGESFRQARTHDHATVLTWIAGLLPLFVKVDASLVNRVWLKIRRVEAMLAESE